MSTNRIAWNGNKMVISNWYVIISQLRCGCSIPPMRESSTWNTNLGPGNGAEFTCFQKLAEDFHTQRLLYLYDQVRDLVAKLETSIEKQRKSVFSPRLDPSNCTCMVRYVWACVFSTWDSSGISFLIFILWVSEFAEDTLSPRRDS